MLGYFASTTSFVSDYWKEKKSKIVAHLLHICTSYCFLHILLFCTFLFHCTFYSYFSFFTIYMPLCCVTLYHFYFYYFALSTERTWFDYISLLIIPCIIYYVTNKETLTLTFKCSFYCFLIYCICSYNTPLYNLFLLHWARNLHFSITHNSHIIYYINSHYYISYSNYIYIHWTK